MDASRAISSVVNIAGYDFSGPFLMSKHLHSMRGIYVILDVLPDESWTVIDLGIADDVRTAVEKNDRRLHWQEHSRGSLAAAALYSHRQADWDNELFIHAKVRSQHLTATEEPDLSNRDSE